MIKELVVHHSKNWAAHVGGGPAVLRPCQQAKLARGAKDEEYAMSPSRRVNLLIVAEPELASRV